MSEAPLLLPYSHIQAYDILGRQRNEQAHQRGPDPL